MRSDPRPDALDSALLAEVRPVGCHLGAHPVDVVDAEAILTVDDDPGVSRAVARDLRRRYGEHNRIVRAVHQAAQAMKGGAR